MQGGRAGWVATWVDFSGVCCKLGDCAVCPINRTLLRNVMESFRELEIYHESKKLAIVVHALSMNLPKHELYEEGSQARRSSKSITSNIVEGFGRRRYKPDFIKHLIYSHSECDETIIHLEFLLETGSSKDTKLVGSLIEQYITLSKRINKFILWVESKYVFKGQGGKGAG